MTSVAAALAALTLSQVGTPDLYASPNWANSKLPVASCSVSGQACQKDADCPGFTPPVLIGFDLVPTGETCTGPVLSGGIKKFVDTLPGLCALGKNDLGQCLPVAVPDTTRFPGADYYELGLSQFSAQFHRDLPATTQVRGYYQKNAPAGDEAGQNHYLGPLIVAQTNRPVRVTFTNELPTGAAGNLFIPTDHTLPGAGLGPNGVDAYTENRASIHLHGGNTPWISDGTQHQWTVARGEVTPYQKGATAASVPDMWFDAAGNSIPLCDGQPTCGVPGATNDPGQGRLTFYWTNQQSGRMMFFHDHAYAITRLNVYAGEAAGYLLANPPDEDALAAATVPGTLGSKFFDPASTAPGATAADLAHLVPLVIQDKTFVPPAPQLAAQDPTWDPAKWGGEGNLWFPHVYMPNQWPGNPDLSNTNPFGRWDYGPWFWPPQTSLDEITWDGKVVPRPLTRPCTTAALVDPVTGGPGTTECPTTPTPSAVPESFLDTMVVNGTAYPTFTVDPAAYRFQILNASQERNVNLSFFVADASGTEVPMVPAVPHTSSSPLPLCAAGAPVDPATGLPSGCWPIKWPVDNRYGGVPDPLAAGPAIVQLGSESGILPAPAVIPAQPVNYEYNRRNVVVLNVSDKALFMGPAERADVVVDFSAYAGKTLILYNDSPAPVPGFDVRLDYFTGDYDQTSTGGAPSTLPGYGPNTRTIMQIKVNAVAATPAPAFSRAAAATALASRFAASQPPPIVPEAVFNPVYGKTFGNTYSPLQAKQLSFTPVCASTTPATCPPGPVTLPMGQKAIQELFDTDYGRMNATLGVEMPTTNFLQQTTIPYANFDPVTEFLTDGQPQIWKITHNGVDTHTVHFHLLSVQIINRVGWDGQIRPPDANELGWKESVRMHPLEIIYVALQPIRQQLPWPIPDMIRPLDVTRPLGTTAQFTGADVNNRPTTVSNDLTNFGWEYVWHCHLLGHEEADMLRAEIFITAPEDPTGLAAVASATPGQALLSWTDASRSAQSFTIERDTSPYFTAPTAFAVAAPAVQPGPVAYTDTTVAPGGVYFYRVKGTKVFSSQAEPGTSYTASSGWSAMAQLGNAPKAVVAPASLAFGSQLVQTTSAAQTATLTNAGSGDLAIAGIALGGADAAAFATSTTCGTTLAVGASCTVSVTFAPASTGAKAASLAFSTSDPFNPTVTVALAGTGVTPVAGVSAASLAFGDQLLTTTSAAQAVTLSNTGTGVLSVGSLALAGADAGQFVLTSGCGATVAAGASCTFTVAFAPTTLGAKTASVVVASSDLANPTITIGLNGNGVIATASVAPAALAFPNTNWAATSAPLVITLSSTGTAALAVGSISITGANPGDFAQTNTCAASLVAGGTCTLSVTFTPSASGARSAAVSIATNDPVNPVVTVALSGTGVAVTTPATALSVTANSPSPYVGGQQVTFTALGSGSLTNGAPTPASGYEYRFQVWNGSAYTIVQPYGPINTYVMTANSVPGNYRLFVEVRTTPTVQNDTFTRYYFSVVDPTTPTPATSLTVTANPVSPYAPNQQVTFTAVGSGSLTNGVPTPASVYQYRFQLWDGSAYTIVQPYGPSSTYVMTANSVPGNYRLFVEVRTTPTVQNDTTTRYYFSVVAPTTPTPATSLTVTANPVSPYAPNQLVTFTAVGSGSFTNGAPTPASVYQYRFQLWDGSAYTIVQPYGPSNTYVMTANSVPGNYRLFVEVRTTSAVQNDTFTRYYFTVQ